MGSVQERGIYARGWGLSRRVWWEVQSVGVTVSTVKMLDLGPTLGREQSEGNRELIDCENRKSGGNRVRTRRSVRVKKWERPE